MALDFNEVVKFMKEFKVDLLNRYGELIIDEPTNTYVSIDSCEDIEDVKTYVVFALCRPIYKGLDDKSSSRLLSRVNEYFNVNLTKQDMGEMYQKLCYRSKLGEFKAFVKLGFPMERLRNFDE